MHDLAPYALLVTVVAGAVLLAILSNRLAERIRVPAPAIFLLASAVASNVVDPLRPLQQLTVAHVVTDQRIVTVALVIILFDGGMHIGWRRMRTAVGAVTWLGIAGTVVTAAAVAGGAHWLFGLHWHAALLLGAALAPTDPAVVFSVLGRREVEGRSGTILQGESGANDPVGIALMISLLEAGGSGWHAVGSGLGSFAVQLVVGSVVGLAGGWALTWVMRHVRLPSDALYPVRTIAFALAVYGVATLAEGSGFLAVFLAGIMVGDLRAPFQRETEHVVGALASLAEIAAFVVLGLSIDLTDLAHQDRLWVGLGLAALLIVVVRPVLVGLVLWPIRLSRGERGFVLFAGLKGAVPILLGTYVVAEGVADAHEIYQLIFVVVLVSVVVQGGLVPTVARRLRVPMTVADPEPWSLGMRFRDEPTGLRRYVVADGSPADGCSVAGLDVGGSFWISMISRDGTLVQVRGDTVLRAGDTVLALIDDDGADELFRADR